MKFCLMSLWKNYKTMYYDPTCQIIMLCFIETENYWMDDCKNFLNLFGYF